MYATEADELDLRDYLVVLRRQKWWIAAITGVVVLVALGLALQQTPVYKASAEILLRARATDTLFNPQTGGYNDPNRRLQTEIAVLQSSAVVKEAEKALGYEASVSASPRSNADIVVVSATSTDPSQAADVANAYATAYVEFRKQEQVQDLADTITGLQNQIDLLQEQINVIDAAAPRGTDPTNDPERQRLVNQQAAFRQQIDQFTVSKELQTGGATVQTEAEAPTSPISPKPKRTGALALAVGLMLGVGVAFLREYLDDSVKEKDDLERNLAGVTVIGLIPAIRDWKDHKRPMIVSQTDPKSPAAEAYRSIRTSIQFLGLDRPMDVLQVTSPSSSEGKTTTLANLAVTLAESGKRVVVVDCDLRRPRIHACFGLPNDVGFTNVLLGEIELADAAQRVPGDLDLFLLASGPLPPNPSEMLSSNRTAEVIESLRGFADVVLLDSPPMLPVTDAAVLSHRVDGMIVVATAGKTTGKSLIRTRELLAQVEAPVIGAVLNGVRSDSEGYAYHYAYAYVQELPRRRAAKQAAKDELAGASADELVEPAPAPPAQNGATGQHGASGQQVTARTDQPIEPGAPRFEPRASAADRGPSSTDT
ncbi:MAG: polysaccharide biosynthesis tyrosine autokinase [Acidimicrobiales bacterium]